MLGISPEAWTAIATFTVAAVALFVALLPELRRGRHRPILQIGYGDAEPYVRVNDVTGEFAPTIRLSVTNKGRSTARSVEATIERWSFRQIISRGPVGEGTSQDIDPVRLRWITLPPAPERGDRPAQVDLAPQATNYLDVVRYAKGKPPELVLDDPRLIRKNHWHRCPFVSAEHWVTVNVTADNAEAVRFIVYFKTGSGLGLYIDVSEADAVPDFPSAGITTLAKRYPEEQYTRQPSDNPGGSI